MQQYTSFINILYSLGLEYFCLNFDVYDFQNIVIIMVVESIFEYSYNFICMSAFFSIKK